MLRKMVFTMDIILLYWKSISRKMLLEEENHQKKTRNYNTLYIIERFYIDRVVS